MLKVPKVLKVLRELKEPKELTQELKELKELKDHKVQQELKVLPQVLKVLRELKEPKVILRHLQIKVQLGHKEARDLQGHKVLLVQYKGLQDFRDHHQELKVLKVT